ncbi:MAG TPA: CPBP family intramembrane metalloprotease [Candidatus Aminicenantes bacterium]|nr:CPBP family intramembrane metalloprotease [Candidatus Aminicenantes bacterium]
MTRGRPGPRIAGAAATGLLAAGLFVALFRFRRLGPLDFWSWLAADIAILAALGFLLDRGYRARLAEDARSGLAMKITVGLVSAAALYAVFAVGRAAAPLVLPSAEAGIAAVYALKAGASPLRIALLIGLVVGPGEELFWRGFFQERVAGTRRPGLGFVLTACVYAAVHLGSGNTMLFLAAGVCGLFWGWLYLAFRSPILNVVSHTLWDLMVFVFLPF